MPVPTKAWPVAFITGASSGIGAALAREYARNRHHLVLCARRPEQLQSVGEECRSLTPDVDVLCVACDVTRRDDLDAAVEKARERFGRLDVVVANAGFCVRGPLEVLTVEDYRRQFETNVFGVLNTVYAALEELKKSRGRLALLGSVCSHVSLPGHSPYTMSKFAVRALAETLFAELAPSGVSVTLISPGTVTSDIRRVDNKGRVRPEWRLPPKRLSMPADKAARIMYKGIQRRKRGQFVTHHARVMVLAQRLLPGLAALALKLTAARRMKKTAREAEA